MLLKNYKKYKLRASSLLEAVFAITVLSICVLIAVKIYVSVLKTSYSYDYLNAISKLDTLIFEVQENHNFTEETFDYEGLKIQKEIEKEGENKIVVNFKAVLKNDTINKSIKVHKRNEE